MGWKNLWLNNPLTKIEGYCINSYGALNYFGINEYKTLWLSFKEIERILNLKTNQEKYSKCKRLFNKKFPQLKKDIETLSKEEQSKLEKLFT